MTELQAELLARAVRWYLDGLWFSIAIAVCCYGASVYRVWRTSRHPLVAATAIFLVYGIGTIIWPALLVVAFTAGVETLGDDTWEE